MVNLSKHQAHIESLIAHNRIEDAREYCRCLSHPNARLWLSEINRMFPIEIYTTDEAIENATAAPLYLYDGEIPADWRTSDGPFEWVDVEILDKEKNAMQPTINYREWLGCIGFYVGAMLVFALIYAGVLFLIYGVLLP